MDPCADMDCCLKVHSNCESCMMKTIEVLRSISGVYSVTWDAAQSIFRISGEVDPNVLLKAVLRTGEHAELLTVKLNHPQLRHRSYNNNNNNNGCGYGYGYGYGYLPYPTSSPYSLLPRMPAGIEYPSCNYDTTTTGHGRGYDYENPQLPQATYLPSYPYQEYDPNDNYEGLNFCTIM